MGVKGSMGRLHAKEKGVASRRRGGGGAVERSNWNTYMTASPVCLGTVVFLSMYHTCKDALVSSPFCIDGS